MKLTDKQYALLREMFHELPVAFSGLPLDVLDAYYTRLYQH